MLYSTLSLTALWSQTSLLYSHSNFIFINLCYFEKRKKMKIFLKREVNVAIRFVRSCNAVKGVIWLVGWAALHVSEDAALGEFTLNGAAPDSVTAHKSKPPFWTTEPLKGHDLLSSLKLLLLPAHPPSNLVPLSPGSVGRPSWVAPSHELFDSKELLNGNHRSSALFF